MIICIFVMPGLVPGIPIMMRCAQPIEITGASPVMTMERLAD
jgi:hypothetical protein